MSLFSLPLVFFTFLWPYLGGSFVYSKVLFKTYEVRSKLTQV